MQRWDLLEVEAGEGARSPVVLHSDDAVRAVLIVLEPGQALGDHQVKEDAWIVVVDGEVELGTDGGPEPARRGALLRFDPDERHSLRTRSGARVLLLLAPWPGDGHYRGDA